MAPAASTEFEPSPQELESAGEELRRRFFAEIEEQKTDVEAAYCEQDLQRLREDNWYCQRFVLHEKGQMDKAVTMVKEAFKWRKEFNVHDIKESNLIPEFFEAQGVYPYNTDVEENPILMLVVKLHKKDAEIQAELRRFLIYWIEKLEKECNGKKMTVIFDCSGAGLSNLDLDVIRFLVTTFKNYYPHLLAYIVVFDMPWLFNAAWKIIKTWLPQDAVEKIKFVNKKTVFEYVSKENLPVAMGGNCTYDGMKEIEDYKETLAKQMKLIRYTNVPVKEDNKTITNNNNNSKRKPNLEVTPVEKLSFPYGSENQKSTTSLVLKNVSKQSLGFKIRGNNIEAYKVKPFNGFLEPNGTQTIFVELVDGQPCLPKDKILVQWVPVENKLTKVQSFNVLWKSAPKILKDEQVLRCCREAKIVKAKGFVNKEEKPAVQAKATVDKQTHRKLFDLDRSVRSLQIQNTILRISLLLLAAGLLPVAWLLYEVVDLLRLQPGGLCDRTVRDSYLAALVCKPDRTILPAHMM